MGCCVLEAWFYWLNAGCRAGPNVYILNGTNVSSKLSRAIFKNWTHITAHFTYMLHANESVKCNVMFSCCDADITQKIIQL